MDPAGAQRLQEVLFRLDDRRVRGAHAVALVGSFNRWDTTVHRLTLGPDGWWRIVVMLAPGTYAYLFIVDGAPWNDPLDDGRVDSEWGRQYSVRVVGRAHEREPRAPDLHQARREELLAARAGGRAGDT